MITNYAIRVTVQDAMSAGVLIPARGVYRNPATGEEMPIANAMNDGLIIVDFTTKTRSPEQTKAVGLITIRTIVRLSVISTQLSFCSVILCF